MALALLAGVIPMASNGLNAESFSQPVSANSIIAIENTLDPLLAHWPQRIPGKRALVWYSNGYPESRYLYESRMQGLPKGLNLLTVEDTLPGAQRLSDNLDLVAALPMLLLFNEAGNVQAYFSLSTPSTVLRRAIEYALASDRSFEDIVDVAQSAPSKLSAGEWWVLGTYDWSARTKLVENEEAVRSTGEMLTRLTVNCRPAASFPCLRLWVLAGNFSAAKLRGELKLTPSEASELRANLSKQISAIAKANVSSDLKWWLVQDLAPEATAVNGDRKAKQAITEWCGIMSSFVSDRHVPRVNRLAALFSMALDVNAGNRCNLTQTSIVSKAQSIYDGTKVGSERDYARYLISSRNLALTTVNSALKAPAIAFIQRDLPSSTNKSYDFLLMSLIADRAGDKRSAFLWAKSAYINSASRSWRLYTGLNAAKLLIRLAPRSDSEIAELLEDVLHNFRGPQDFHGDWDTGHWLDRFETAVRSWNKGGEHSEVVSLIRARIAAKCDDEYTNDHEGQSRCLDYLKTS